MFGLLLAAQVAPLADMKSSMEPVSVEAGVNLFQKVCYANFPDPKAAAQIIADPSLGLTKSPKTPSQAMQPGDVWTSSTLRVTYVDAAWLPRDFGSPQCSVTMLLQGSPAHGDVAHRLMSQLGLPVTKIGKDGPRSQTQWDKPGIAPDTWRLFLTTQQTPSGVEMSAMIMNLRGKKKN